MGCVSNIAAIIILAASIIVAYQLHSVIYNVPPIPEMKDIWWGLGSPPSKENISINPFKIIFKDEVIQDLKNRLSKHKIFTSPLEGIQHQYGINTKFLEQIIKYWLTKYNWREQEQILNQYPQFTTNIQGLNIHYIHVKPKLTKNIRIYPLLLLHGWPGSVREFYEMIPFLTVPQGDRNYALELIIPSLPGYGFSDSAVRPGLSDAEIAVIFKNLMNRLGFEKYFVQGGDWGASITNLMAAFYPDKILGTHSNMCVVSHPLTHIKTILFSFYPKLIIDEKYVERVYPLSEKFATLLLEFGYLHIQATKPDTIGVALNDSPVGLAAYILEKFITWTNLEWRGRLDGGLSEKYTFDKLIDNIMIYWITGSITTSMRLYAETINKKQFESNYARIPITVPSACARFKYDLFYHPDFILKDRYYQLLHTSDYDGGHFAAFEMPKTLAEDILLFVDKVVKQ